MVLGFLFNIFEASESRHTKFFKISKNVISKTSMHNFELKYYRRDYHLKGKPFTSKEYIVLYHYDWGVGLEGRLEIIHDHQT